MATRAQFSVREEVLNVVLAELLDDRGLLSIPESIRPSRSGSSRRLPDVTVADLFGVRAVIEGRIETSGSVSGSLLSDAKARVEEGISPICLAVLYPPELREVRSLQGLRRAIAAARLKVLVVAENRVGEWAETDLDGVADLLRRSYELLVDEDVVVAAASELGDAIETAAECFAAVGATPARLRTLLGVPEPDEPTSADDMRVSRIAALTIVNAMIFQVVISEREPRVQALARAVREDNVSEALATAWRLILDEIDYVPIFRLGHEILVELRGSAGQDNVLRELARSAMRITDRRAALRHDLMGRVYHRLMAERSRKYFGAFYTTIPAASLLLKLALDPDQIPVDWSDVRAVGSLRVADLACGTGTLLKASLQALVDNYVRASAHAGGTPDLAALHKELVEHGLWGYDVIPFAIHLAASALVIHQPDVHFGEMQLRTLPLSGRHARNIRLGSLDFVSGRVLEVQADLFGASTGPGRMTGSGDQRGGRASRTGPLRDEPAFYEKRRGKSPVR